MRRLLCTAAVACALALVSVSAPAQPYGVNAHIPDPEILDAVQAAGITWIRIDVLWSWVEPQRGVFEWNRYDTLVEQALARGLRIFATISSTPAWATDGPAGTGVPRDARDWYDLCYRAAERYRGRIDYWGMWNEPNLPRFWAGSRSEYITVILKTGSEAVHAANPRGRVCGPELAHLQSASWDSWLGDVLAQASGFLDVVTHHVYPDGADAGSVVRALTEGGQYPWEPPSVRHVLDDGGWLGRPFWLTETGYEAPFGDTNGEAMQASFVMNLLFYVLSPNRSVTWVDKVFIYEMSDSGFALLGPRPALTPRPSWEKYRDLIAVSLVDDADLVDAEVPSRLPPSASATVTITVANRGTTAWSAQAGYRLTGEADAMLFGFPAEGLAPTNVVAPGGRATFSFTIVAPPAASPMQPYELAWRMAGTSSGGFGEDLRRSLTVTTQIAPMVSYLPSLANSDGLNGTHWRSDLTLYNASSTSTSVEIALLEAGHDNSFPRLAHVTLPGRNSVRVVNVLGSLFGWNGTGALRVSAEGGDLRASARTYTTLAAGTSGQYVPSSPALSAAAPGNRIDLIGLVRSPDPSTGFRTNLGVVNPTPIAVTADVELFGDGSQALGTVHLDVPPFGFLQVTDIYSAVGAFRVSGGRALVRTSTPGGAVLAYASRVDNRSGDPSYLAPAHAFDDTAVIAAAAHNAGFNGSEWRTDLDLFNPGETPVTCDLAFLPNTVPSAEGAPSRSVVVAPGEVRSFADVVGTLFGIAGAGAIAVTPSDGAVMIGSRTYNLGAAGTFGQLVPAVAVGRAATLGDEVHLPQLAGSADRAVGFRTNIGLLNLSPTPIDLVVTVYRNPQNVLGQLKVSLAPHEWRQLNDVYALVPRPAEEGFARVGTTTPGARFLAYASVVDNVTGDPSFVPGW